jgi:hypothetical protein
LNLVQPLLRGGGRAVALEQLTIAERALLANLRAFQRYRQGFYTKVAIGPLSTFRSRVGDFVMWRVPGGIQGEIVELSQITVSVDDVTSVDETAAAIKTLLKQYHAKEDDAVVVPKELLRQAERTRSMFNLLLVVIAGISLLVGGIGIMNIMLATVTERTREIGIRRALGATRSHIVQQFLTETIVLTASGGLLGVLFGLLCGPLFRGLRAAPAFPLGEITPRDGRFVLRVEVARADPAAKGAKYSQQDWVHYTVDLSAHAGKTITVLVEVHQTDKRTYMLVDDVELWVKPRTGGQYRSTNR